jgi:electron transfer flavoprotein alpha subunit
MLPTARRVLAAHASGLIGRAPALNVSALARQRLLSTLAVLEQKDGQLNPGSLSAFTAAQKLGGTIHGFVAGSNIKGVAADAAKVDGVEKIVAVENGAYEKVL